ncbi:hypothetical protein RDI58_018566 [Solanum bulbocastanum]|uniref:Uncharacterized protein n=1 Tax=Solanum bulbocastanum TaxID=147425 RepID=A0AAN8YB34_SOLBU
MKIGKIQREKTELLKRRTQTPHPTPGRNCHVGERTKFRNVLDTNLLFGH